MGRMVNIRLNPSVCDKVVIEWRDLYTSFIDPVGCSEMATKMTIGSERCYFAVYDEKTCYMTKKMVI